MMYNVEKDLKTHLCCLGQLGLSSMIVITTLEVRSQSKISILCSVLTTHLMGALNKNQHITVGKNICVLGGRMTPVQRSIIRRQPDMDTDLFIDLLTWSIRRCGHKGYCDVTPPDENLPSPCTMTTMKKTIWAIQLTQNWSAKTNHVCFQEKHRIHLSTIQCLVIQICARYAWVALLSMLMYCGSYLKYH